MQQLRNGIIHSEELVYIYIGREPKLNRSKVALSRRIFSEKWRFLLTNVVLSCMLKHGILYLVFSLFRATR